EDQIVLNSTRNGSYQEEERRPNTLQRGEIYTIEFIAETGNAIRIYVNGEHVTTFYARPGDDFNDVDSIKIDESIKVHSVSLNA
ncbi:galectin, partial [Aphelenchoides avenae]